MAVVLPRDFANAFDEKQLADICEGAFRGPGDKTPDPDDRRRSIITVTEAGEHAVDAVRQRRMEGTTQILDGWSTADLRVLTDMFTRYNTEIADHYRLPKPPWTQGT